MAHELPLVRSVKPANCPYPDSDPVHATIPLLERFILMLYSHLRLGLPSCLFPSGSLTTILRAILSTPYALHAPTISSV
jgi:hypothetical protein